jgi:hypothetical protein
MAAKTDSKLNTNVKTGVLSASHASNLYPPKTPIKIMAPIWNAIPEYLR